MSQLDSMKGWTLSTITSQNKNGAKNVGSLYTEPMGRVAFQDVLLSWGAVSQEACMKTQLWTTIYSLLSRKTELN